ncbi:hypothetical protein LCI18_015001 [Fusarium solani-melongenae]|uniref:Uncharacterized protein n=1 Tax=Fusarium solani subsp. cucurbitae TaxID=2747967 RepID=A0ACD3ZSB0_FUSSC|nr:hypothetical protein LCI18_015001 [Fusarium solani-melongenae]
MKPMLLLSGDRANFTTVAVDFEKGELKVLANYPAPYNVSWVEPVSSHGNIDRLVGLSEGEEFGLLFTFEVDHAQETCRITSQQPTLGAPAHIITLQDKSALAIGTYLGGSAALYPVSITESDGLRLKDRLGTALTKVANGNAIYIKCLKTRENCCADRVWILARNNLELEVCGWLQCPPGTGARHAVFTPDEKIMYVLGELSHNVVAFDLSNCPANDVQPIDGFSVNIIPPTVHRDHQFMMDSAELSLHPKIPNVLYASNRWERHIANREPHLENVPTELPQGDTIVIILLSDNGKRVQETKHVRTNLDTIRGFRLSDDGNYIAVAGQEGGGIEMYRIGGLRGDEWSLTASLREGLDSGIKHVVWI